MPLGASSTRSESTAARSANFDALYGPRNGTAKRPAIEPMKMARPLLARSAGMNACVIAICPNTLTSNCLRHISIGRRSVGPATEMPALFTNPASGSLDAASVSTAAAMPAASVTSSRIARTSPCAASIASAASSLRTPAKTA